MDKGHCFYSPFDFHFYDGKFVYSPFIFICIFPGLRAYTHRTKTKTSCLLLFDSRKNEKKCFFIHLDSIIQKIANTHIVLSFQWICLSSAFPSVFSFFLCLLCLSFASLLWMLATLQIALLLPNQMASLQTIWTLAHWPLAVHTTPYIFIMFILQ